ncbi:hypothetical protein FO519_009961, partial [Halicephalobus sp. NKZ332]
VAAWVDGNLKFMSEAVRSHFFVQHVKNGGTDESDFDYRYERRPKDMPGSRRGLLAYVQLHGEEYPTKYNVKCHHFGSSTTAPKGSFPDIKEIFCYKLLELLGVGPAVQFILPSVLKGNKTFVYIATKWRDDFIPLSDLKNEEDINVEALVQLLLLNVLFFISDLHDVIAVRQWRDTKTASIVDFIAGYAQIYPDVKKKLFDDRRVTHWDETHFDLLVKCCGEKRLEIVKKWLQEWDLLSKIDDAEKQIRDEKDRMKKQEISFTSGETVTDDLNEYIHGIKSNIKNLTSVLGLNG